MNIKQDFLTVNRYSRPGTKLSGVRKIAVHYVGNPGTSAQANRNYFESLKAGSRDSKGQYVYASSHYIIGLGGEVVQCIPESEVSYATNQANPYSISIECCHPDIDGKFTVETEQTLAELCAALCLRYKLDPVGDIVRHYDVTGKNCPKYYVDRPEAFEAFRRRVKDIMGTDIQSDTSGTVQIRRGAYYTAKFSGVNAAKLTVTAGTGGVVTIVPINRGADKLAAIVPIGKPGDATGIYTMLPGGKPMKRFVAQII